MPYLISALIGIVATISTIFGVYNYVSLDILETAEDKRVGATITTIQGTDTLSASRSVINTNFSNLNTQLLTVTGTTSISTLTTASNLVVVGTLTSGALGSGFTAVNVAQGGTGRSTLTSGAVLYGLGTSAVGLAGPCSDNQVIFYTSSVPGCGSSAVDETINRNWTGTTRIKTLIASSTITISDSGAGVSYILPTTQGNASTTLFNNGSGNLTWQLNDWRLLASTTVTGVVATTTLTWWGATSTQIQIYVFLPPVSNSGERTDINFQFNSDTGNNYGWTNTAGGTTASASNVNVYKLAGAGDFLQEAGSNSIEMNIFNLATQKKHIKGVAMTSGASAAIGTTYIFSGLWNNTTQTIGSVSIGGGSNGIKVGTHIMVLGSKQ